MNASQAAQDARYGDMDAQTVLRLLGRGRDQARTLGDLAEDLGWSRRRVEKAVRALRLADWFIASGGDGVWLADTVEIDTTIASLQRRLVSQYLTLRKLREARKRYGTEQLRLFGEAA